MRFDYVYGLGCKRVNHRSLDIHSFIDSLFVYSYISLLAGQLETRLKFILLSSVLGYVRETRVGFKLIC